MSRVFKTQVVSRYSNIENGIIAQQQVNGQSAFLINTASYHIEILKTDTDEPAAPGELGRIVVTDLYNYAMPFIRYDTGDIGAFSESDSQYLKTVEGRRMDQIFRPDGELISSFIVIKNMWQYVEINQFQFIQVGEKDYLLKINTDRPFKSENKLISEFKEYLGEEAQINIEYVNEIPLLASGKRKKIVNINLKK